ncbi:MAG: aspartate--tRNA(Asn) ligase [bacterium]
MERTYTAQAGSKPGEKVRLMGFLQTARRQSKIQFLILRDVTGTIQCVVSKEHEAVFAAAEDISLESVIVVEGVAVAAPQAPGGAEIQVESVEVLSAAAPELPIPVVEKGEGETDQSLRLDYRWLDLRKPKNLLIFQVWTTFEEAFMKYFLEKGFLEIHSPKFMSAPSESGAELFTVDYFGGKAYLAQSPQFYKQMAMASGFEKVFEVGPVFRAEPSFTTRHATEFTGYDFEMSFIDSHEDIAANLEGMIASVLTTIKERHGEKIKELFGRELVVPTLPFPRVTLAEAKELLKPFDIKSDKVGDLNPEEEKKLSEVIMEKHGHEFVFVTEYPIESRAFYHMRYEDRPGITRGFDLMWNGVEITTGAQREHRYEVLKKQALDKGLTEASIGTYLDFFKYGCPPHGGAGIGPVRMMMKMFNTENIREVTYLHRGVNRLTP